MNTKKVIYAKTLGLLQAESIGHNHDHCKSCYFGKIENVPNKYKYLIKKTKMKYVFIYEEDVPPEK